jgi:DnaK suppressor protein
LIVNTAVELEKVFNYAAVRERLTQRRGELTDRERRVRRDLMRAGEPLVADFADRAIQMQNDEPLQAIGAAAHDELAQIDTALARLAAGTYETCEICDEPIGATRLAVVPYATICTDCALDEQD